VRDVLEAALRAEQDGEPAALVTVIATEGSTPQKAGAKMLVYADGRSSAPSAAAASRRR
jgi:xanthine dehydrogenase accessory factor